MRIRVNGHEYESWEDVPEEQRTILRKVLPDTDHDGVPDAVEGTGDPGTFHGHIVATETTRLTRVPRRGSRPGFRFQMTDTTVRAVPPEPGDHDPDPPAATTATASDGPILLNGVPVDAEGRPLDRKRWWRRR